MKKFLFASIFISGIFLSLPANSSAYVTCQQVYGGGETCIQVGKIFIAKTVQNPQTSAFVDNLSVNEPKFSPEQNIQFRLTVTNNDNATAKNVVVQDTYPQYVNFTSGEGKFDNNTKTLTIEVGELKAGESKTYTLQGKIVSAQSIPGGSGVVCVVNQATAATNGNTSQDNAQFCIEKKVLGVVYPPQQVTVTPPTGIDTLALFGFIPGAIVGFMLRRSTKIKVHKRYP